MNSILVVVDGECGNESEEIARVAHLHSDWDVPLEAAARGRCALVAMLEEGVNRGTERDLPGDLLRIVASYCPRFLYMLSRIGRRPSHEVRQIHLLDIESLSSRPIGITFDSSPMSLMDVVRWMGRICAFGTAASGNTLFEIDSRTGKMTPFISYSGLEGAPMAFRDGFALTARLSKEHQRWRWQIYKAVGASWIPLSPTVETHGYATAFHWSGAGSFVLVPFHNWCGSLDVQEHCHCPIFTLSSPSEKWRVLDAPPLSGHRELVAAAVVRNRLYVHSVAGAEGFYADDCEPGMRSILLTPCSKTCGLPKKWTYCESLRDVGLLREFVVLTPNDRYFYATVSVGVDSDAPLFRYDVEEDSWARLAISVPAIVSLFAQ